MVKHRLLLLISILFFLSCQKNERDISFSVSGRVTNSLGTGIEGVKIYYNSTDFTLTDQQGYWIITITNINKQQVITPILLNYTFVPSTIQVAGASNNMMFKGTQTPSNNQQQIFNWFNNQQLANGLLESAENGNIVSLYDNALAAMVFMLNGNFTKAEKIFNFFNARISTELTKGVGGFSQLRDKEGVPNNRRWMGDNAWLLIALNNYKNITGKTTYDQLASEISKWLIKLQDTDGGLYAGYDPNNSLLDYKVTEGNIDSFNAIVGYTGFHSQLLRFLKNDRWSVTDKNLVAWPSNPTYLYALDLHSWSYSIFKDYPVSSLTTAKRFLTTQTATNQSTIMGYCFDEDKDAVWLEGTGQMALAFGVAGMQIEKERFLLEMDKVFLQSKKYANASGFPYASNPGTTYGSDALWSGAPKDIAISGGAWYLFAKYGFNPFAVGRDKNIPKGDMFWLN